MRLSLRYATEADTPTLGQINVACFKQQELWGSAYPSLADETVLPAKVSRALQKLSDPETHVVIAVDSDAPGQPVVGYSRWSIPGTPSHVELSPTGQGFANAESLPEGTNRKVLEAFKAKLKECRKAHWVEGDLSEYFSRVSICGVDVDVNDTALDFLATLPQYQGRGVASSMIRWGIEQATVRQAGIFLEATMDGYALYRKYGWEDVYELIMEYEPWGGKGSQKFMLMRRAP